ncbi:unnamed protein product [Kuraishia capsulata CBS 1993]|uniref:SPX domain-containing protein n=1 Tax=Kuraishia capsulata CBS 1993 TaxID=1382522 RepID=W6MTE6_9ASCO|nr:uncharacterized protein KUCA_T00000972001 [Kuraishia capsulata CBS 1993]CDK25005.1 unnamed protein product [Kuraishia capsulata CBS 1993]
MKFGQELERNKVPEWQSQYLDYKKGKKKLKKLDKVTALSSGSLRSKTTPRLSFSAFKRTSTDGNISNDSRLSSLASLNLPPPAISPSPSKKNHSSNDTPGSADKPNDRTPLLQATGVNAPGILRHADANSSVESLDSEASQHGQRHEDMPTPVHFKSQTYGGSHSSPYTLERKRSAVGALYDSIRRPRLSSYGGRTIGGEIPLEPIAEYARSEFLNWVDAELSKIEVFYKEREDSSSERFWILEEQIELLKEQNIRRLRKAQQIRANERMDENLDSSNTNGDGTEDLGDDQSDNLAGFKRDLLYFEFSAKRAIGWLNNFETPSLPRFKWRAEGGVEKQYYEEDYNEETPPPVEDPRYNRKDYSRKTNVPYLVAKRQIRVAVLEFYRSLELLKSYKLLNKIAFRKMVKKFDKTTGSNIQATYMEKVNNAYFLKSDVVDNLMTKVEDMYSSTFERGNRKVAVARLRSSDTPATYYTSIFTSGLLLGIGTPFFVLATYLGTYKTVTGNLESGRYILQIWGGFAIAIFMALLFGINCYIWTKFKINYKFIFEFDQRTALDVKQFFLLPSLMFGLASMFAWFGFSDFWPHIIAARDWPWFFVGISLGIIFCPFDTFYRSSRAWILTAIWRLLLSGFYPVEFRDFFIGDILCSLTYSISNISLFLCLYSTHWRNTGETGLPTKCGSSRSRVMGFLSTVPSLMRFMQCLRRYADTGDWFPHLANMLKYTMSAVYYITLSVYRISTTTPNRAILITFASINSIYSAIWDIFMDWSLMQAGSKHIFLRDDLIFKSPWYYYIAMVVDVILRFQWIFYALFTRQIQQSAVTSFGIAIAELLRRFIWIFFRMENEHCTNVHLFRASRETPLPYPVLHKAHYSHVHIPTVDLGSADEEATSISAPPKKILKRRPSIFPQFLEHASNVINKAHIKDFQRKKFDPALAGTRDDESSEEEDDDDDDDENDENEALQGEVEELDSGSDDEQIARRRTGRSSTANND